MKLAVFDIEINEKQTDGSYNILHPITKAKNVIFSSGGSVEDELKVEKGVWTPVLGGSTSSSQHGYHTQKGWYTRIGNIVIIDFLISISTKRSMGGQAQISGLPFTPDTNYEGSCSISRFSRLSMAGGYVIPGFTIINGVLAGYKSAPGPDKSLTALSSSDINHGTLISGSAIYRIKK